MECEFPTINSKSDEILNIFKNTKTIAIVGLSPDPTKASNIVASYLQSVGFKIVPIYPKEDVILGEKVYKSLSEVPFNIDMVDMFRKPEIALQIVEESIKRGDVKTIWLQLGIVNNEAAQKAKDSGLNIVQNKCTKIEHKALFS